MEQGESTSRSETAIMVTDVKLKHTPGELPPRSRESLHTDPQALVCLPDRLPACPGFGQDVVPGALQPCIPAAEHQSCSVVWYRRVHRGLHHRDHVCQREYEALFQERLVKVFTDFLQVFECSTPSDAWKPDFPKPTCNDLRVMYYSTAGIHILTDLAVLLLPIKPALALNVNRRRKGAQTASCKIRMALIQDSRCGWHFLDRRHSGYRFLRAPSSTSTILHLR